MIYIYVHMYIYIYIHMYICIYVYMYICLLGQDPCHYDTGKLLWQSKDRF